MTREVDRILARAHDEVELEKAAGKPGADGRSEPPDADPVEDTIPRDAAGDKKRTPLTGRDAFSLPGVPSRLVDPPQPREDEGGSVPFALPAVPSTLVDPASEGADAEQDRAALDFENDITVRMAALKGLGSGVNTDSFGMPSAPTFQPEDQPVRGTIKKPGYTDEDQKTWCIVCLEDATIRCIGCDDDVYCARCWREMHRGPSAGYDERGHEWVKFER